MTAVNWTAITTFNDVLGIANTNTGGWFWTGILVMIILVLFMSLLAFGPEAALLVSLFIGLMLGTFLLYMDLIPFIVVGVIVGIMFFMIIYLMYSSRQQPT